MRSRAIERFGFAMVNNQRVVVNRHSHRIVEVD